MLHSKKSQSILQWFNSLTTKGDINSLTQFTDGSHFYEIVASLQPVFIPGLKEGNLSSESVIFSEASIASNEEVITSVEEEVSERKLEISVSESGNADPFVIKESDDTDTHKKYEIIRKFIDNFYHVDSSSFIDYGECQSGKELELAKVAVFLLSATVQKLLSSEDKIVYNTTLLEPEVQENIRECLSLVLVEKDSGENQFKKTELHKILSRPASFKGTPIRKQPSRSALDTNESSESVKNLPKKRRERTSVIIYEDVQDSALKNLLESPKIQYKAAIYKKEAELLKVRSALHNEENKVMDLTFENKNLKDELEKARKDMEIYKKQMESIREEMIKKEDLSTEEYENKKLEDERIKKLIETQKEEIKQLKESNEAQHERIVEIEGKLKQDTPSSHIEEIYYLKDKIKSLELENEEMTETIRVLNEKVADLQHDLKNYQQMYQDFSAPTNRKELRSPNVSETLSTIIYADEHSSRDSLERKDNSDTKDDKIKQLASQHRIDTLKNRDQSVESPQLISTLSQSTSPSVDKEKLKYYEMKYGPMPRGALNSSSIKNEKNKLDSSSDSKVGGQLWPDLSVEDEDVKLETVLTEGKIQAERSALFKIVQELEKRGCLASLDVKKLNESCGKISNTYALSACLRDMAFILESKQPTTRFISTRSSRSLAAEDNINSLTRKNRNLEHELEVVKQSTKLLLSKMENKLKTAHKNVLDEKTENEKLKQEIAIVQEKYIRMHTLAKNKDNDVKRTFMMYQKIAKSCAEARSKQCGKACEEMKRKWIELNKDCIDLEKEKGYLKCINKDLKGQLETLRYDVKELTKENKELKHKLFIETSAMSDNIPNRDAAVFHYMSNSKHGPPKEPQLEKNEGQGNSSQPQIKFHRYQKTEPSVSNSMMANRSIQSGFFQAADEDDFLNHSSLAEICNGGIPEDESKESRLQEIRRRNTLVLPHLQSCYPLEIQNMTPSEKKYYDADEVSFDLARKSSQYDGKKDFSKAFTSKFMDSDSDDSDDSDSVPVKKDNVFPGKRKHVERDQKSMPAPKKQCRPAPKVIVPKKTPSTPLKRVAAFVRKHPTFRTPVSVHRLMCMPRKSKAH